MAERLRTKSMENSLMVELQQGFSLSPVEVKILLVKVLECGLVPAQGIPCALRKEEKNLRNVLIKKLVKDYGNKLRIAEVLADDVLDALEEYAPRQDRLKPGQLVWYAVNLREQRTQGKKNNNG